MDSDDPLQEHICRMCYNDEPHQLSLIHIFGNLVSSFRFLDHIWFLFLPFITYIMGSPNFFDFKYQPIESHFENAPIWDILDHLADSLANVTKMLELQIQEH